MRIPAIRSGLVKTAAFIASFVFISSCDSGGSGGTTAGDQPADTTPPVALAVPPSLSTINGQTEIVITFDKSMSTSSKTLGGTLNSESDGGIWSDTSVENDTLTVSPVTTWSAGDQTLTLKIDGINGVAMNTLNLQYKVDTALQVKSISPSSNATIVNQQAIVITFDEPVDTGTLVGGGTLWPESDAGSWSTVTLTDDTLTISPSGTWSTGAQTLSISITDSVGNQTTLLLNYTITTDGDSDGVTVADGDCDDTKDNVYPGADEYCDGVDNNCNGQTDESGALDESTFYRDFDDDTYGDPADPKNACSAPAGYVIDNTDCDDADAAINPAATEICDLQDNDCNGLTDEPEAVDAINFYIDADGDTFGDDSALPTLACFTPASHVDNALDCDDSTSAIFPGNTEVCDGLDNDCANGVDDSPIPPTDPCEATNEYGTCSGTWSCGGVNGWTCDAQPPSGPGPTCL